MDRTPRGLNWGCGPVIAEGWLNADVDVMQPGADSTRPGGAVFPLDDPPNLPAGWTGRFDGIVANHSLQCLTYDELDPTVAEFHRVLRPEGRLRVLVPDVWQAFREYQEENSDWPGFAAITEPWSLERKFAHYLTWGGSNRTCFTRESLRELLLRHDFRYPTHRDIADTTWEWLGELDSRLGESIVVEVIRCG